MALILSATLLAAVYLCSIEPTGALFLRPLESRYPALRAADAADASATHIVVLGGGASQGAPDESGRASLGPDAMKRLLYGYRLYLRTGLPVVVSGGAVLRPGAEPEAEAARRLLLELGMPPDKVTAEGRSRNTWENAARCREILGPGSGTVLLVTSAYHMPRSVACFQANGFTCVPAPTDYKVDQGPFSPVGLLPSASSLADLNKALREYWGLLYYRIGYGGTGGGE